MTPQRTHPLPPALAAALKAELASIHTFHQAERMRARIHLLETVTTARATLALRISEVLEEDDRIGKTLS